MDTHGYNQQSAILNGVPLYDTDGAIVNAHGACIVKDGGRWYLFGEYKSDESNAFHGFSCYVSDDLLQWRFVRMALPVTAGLAGADRVGERVKVMRCPATGRYVLYFHSDDLRYCDQHTAYAVSDRIDGEYVLQGAVCLDGKPLRHWDMGTFQDSDGTGYLLEDHGDIYRLSDDYATAVEKLPNVRDNCTDAPDADLRGLGTVGEAPALFAHEGVYYLLYSDTTSWEKNDNYYLTAPSIRGPWTRRGSFCPRGTLTYNSQTTFVLPLGGGRFMYMGDRWSFPHQASAATYVWLPVQARDGHLSVPAYAAAWSVQSGAPVALTAGWQRCTYERVTADGTCCDGTANAGASQHDSASGAGASSADGVMAAVTRCNSTPNAGAAQSGSASSAGDSDSATSAATAHAAPADSGIETLTATFTGSQCAVIGSTGTDGCYARVRILRGDEAVCSAVIDFYAKAAERDGLRYVSPVLPVADYRVEITNLHDKPNWTDKTKTRYGSTGYAVRVAAVLYRH